MIQQQTAFLAVYVPWDCLTSSTKAPTYKKDGIVDFYFYVLVENLRGKVLTLY